MILNITIKLGKSAGTINPQFAGYSGVTLIVTPGSLHASGELYDLKKIAKSDLIVPRALLDEFRLHEANNEYLYLVRVPAIGLGSMSLMMGEDYTPALVPNAANNHHSVT